MNTLDRVRGDASRKARRFLWLAAGLSLLMLAGAAVFLASWDIPAPSTQVEKTIPNDRFAR